LFIVSVSGRQKPESWANFDMSGTPAPTSFSRWKPNLVC